MKNILALLFLAAILVFSSCKKENKEITLEPIDETEPFLSDSTSFTVNGKLYVADSFSGTGYGNNGTNVKLSDKNSDWVYNLGDKYWAGAPDSIQFFRFLKSNINDHQGVIEFSFLKNYAKMELQKEGWIYTPADFNELFVKGNYNYALDYKREGKQEGTAINLELEGKELSSFSPLHIADQTKLNSESQHGSKFEILKVQPSKNNKYLQIEAFFEANLFDKDEKPIRITNGFLRFRVSKAEVTQ